MKKALLFCFGLLLLAAAQLQAAPANANFASERGTLFNLSFDGRPLTRGGARQVHLDLVAPGPHWAEFMIPVAYGPALRYRTRVFLDPGLETSFVLLTRPGRAPELRKVAAVPLRGGYGPGYGGPATGYPNNGYFNNDGGYGGGAYNNGPQPPINQNGRYGNNEGNYPPNNGNYPPNNGNGNGNGNYPDNGGYYPGSGVSYNRTMSPQDVEGLVAAVHRQSFDKDKLPLMQQALRETAVRADDLTRLMKELSFEESRLTLAKFGAGRVADRQNLYRLNDGFTFSATAREFQEYLAQQP